MVFWEPFSVCLDFGCHAGNFGIDKSRSMGIGAVISYPRAILKLFSADKAKFVLSRCELASLGLVCGVEPF